MYEIVVMPFVDNERKKDWIYATKYTRKVNAERKARDISGVVRRGDWGTYTLKAYVRKELRLTTEEEAKKRYCSGYSVYVVGTYGKEKLRSSHEYGSHASCDELFYRSASVFNFGNKYNGDYYVEVDD